LKIISKALVNFPITRPDSALTLFLGFRRSEGAVELLKGFAPSLASREIASEGFLPVPRSNPGIGGKCSEYLCSLDFQIAIASDLSFNPRHCPLENNSLLPLI
jgi:hypothetical protein